MTRDTVARKRLCPYLRLVVPGKEMSKMNLYNTAYIHFLQAELRSIIIKSMDLTLFSLFIN